MTQYCKELKIYFEEPPCCKCCGDPVYEICMNCKCKIEIGKLFQSYQKKRNDEFNKILEDNNWGC